MWWQDLLFGLWNGWTAWIVLVAHILGTWEGFPLYDGARQGNWYDLGFVLGAASPLFGLFSPHGRAKPGSSSRRRNPADRQDLADAADKR